MSYWGAYFFPLCYHGNMCTDGFCVLKVQDWVSSFGAAQLSLLMFQVDNNCRAGGTTMAMARVKIWQAWVGLIPSGIGQGTFPNHADKWQACAAVKWQCLVILLFVTLVISLFCYSLSVNRSMLETCGWLWVINRQVCVSGNQCLLILTCTYQKLW